VEAIRGKHTFHDDIRLWDNFKKYGADRYVIPNKGDYLKIRTEKSTSIPYVFFAHCLTNEKEIHTGISDMESDDGSEEEMESKTILDKCLNLLHVRDNIELLATLEKYKKQQDGQKEALTISADLKKARVEARRKERQLQKCVYANDAHQRKEINVTGYSNLADEVKKKPRLGKREREALKKT